MADPTLGQFNLILESLCLWSSSQVALTAPGLGRGAASPTPTPAVSSSVQLYLIHGGGRVGKMEVRGETLGLGDRGSDRGGGVE